MIGTPINLVRRQTRPYLTVYIAIPRKLWYRHLTQDILATLTVVWGSNVEFTVRSSCTLQRGGEIQVISGTLEGMEACTLVLLSVWRHSLHRWCCSWGLYSSADPGCSVAGLLHCYGCGQRTELQQSGRTSGHSGPLVTPTASPIVTDPEIQ